MKSCIDRPTATVVVGLLFVILLLASDGTGAAPISDHQMMASKTFKDHRYGDSSRRAFFVMLKIILTFFGKH